MDLNFYLDQKVALVILLITVATSFYALEMNHQFFIDLALRPYYFFKHKHYATLVTSGFLHGSFNHLLFNMLTFYFFAFDLESMTGSIPFLILYFGALIFSDIHTLIINKNNPQYLSIGASGAITAVIFATVLYNPNMAIYIFFLPIPIPAPIFAFIYIFVCIYLDKKDHRSNINHLAHLWGALSGIAITTALNPPVLSSFINNIDISTWF